MKQAITTIQEPQFKCNECGELAFGGVNTGERGRLCMSCATTPAPTTGVQAECQHLNALAYTEDGQRYHGCRDCGETFPQVAPTRVHTATPWITGTSIRGLMHDQTIFCNAFDTAHPIKIATCGTPSDAAFIVKAVNNHDKLIAALEQCMQTLRNVAGSSRSANDAIKAARHALNTVEGE